MKEGDYPLTGVKMKWKALRDNWKTSSVFVPSFKVKMQSYE
ncbi:MAG: hypothetical protein Ct9H300mP13_3750 [Gammaproteobacteria bacterium]|nr:MAG: hypothetical protein Ct9H300mP13_3750 [Gammaproteobacteria bacterium]